MHGMLRVVCVLAVLVLSLPAIATCPDQDANYSRTFRQHGREYQVRFLKALDEKAWPFELVMRWRVPGGRAWHVVSRVKGVRLEKEVTIPGPRGRDLDALVLSSPGGSAQFITIVEIAKSPPRFRVLLWRARDKGGFHYLTDRHSRLTKLKFDYWAWHVEAQDCPGHAFTSIDVVWSPRRHRFITGQPYVDATREKSASFVDILTDIVPDESMAMEETHDPEGHVYTYTYKPAGLLLQKTPPEFRSAKRVKVVVDYGAPPDHEPRIVSIEATGK